MKHNIHLLIIDPQNDFIDLPEQYLPFGASAAQKVGLGREPMTPALPVPGAHLDMLRLADAIKRGSRGLAAITVTLDSHHHWGIERPGFWVQGDGEAVMPFTEITAESVHRGVYRPRNPNALGQVQDYLHALESRGRYQLMVWPVHCEIGTWGHNVHADVRAAYNIWELEQLALVTKVNKGSNPWTEHYSALMAEVPDDNDPATQLNRSLIDALSCSEQIFVGGEASSHCVKATVEHLVAHLDPVVLKNIVILTDCMSPVAGFENAHHEFLADMKGRGLQMASAEAMAAELIANARK